MKRKMKALLKNEKGLTLIELLAVIVILGIIAAIAIPSIGGIIDKTKDDAKVADGIQIIKCCKNVCCCARSITDSTAAADNQLYIINATVSLRDYLDNVKDIDFTVTITNVSGKKVGKYSYTFNKS